jgi:NAD(P)-dependent dehydrogenase (short-subunit alcohol dehydrogenase family)
MSGRLAGKRCIVTGIGSGMGRKAAELFCAEGAQVVGSDVNLEAARETVQQVTAAGGRIVLGPQGDLTEPAACQALVAFAERELGSFGVLYNNAANAFFAPMDEIETELWDKNILHELSLAFYMCHAAWPALKRNGGGSIINVGSLAAHRGMTYLGNVAHMAAKAGVIAMTRQMAVEGAKYGIRVNSVSPGGVVTGATAFLNEDPDYQKFVRDTFVMGRMARPEEVVNYAVFLATDESSYVTGTHLLIDGGQAVLQGPAR